MCTAAWRKPQEHQAIPQSTENCSVQKVTLGVAGLPSYFPLRLCAILAVSSISSYVEHAFLKPGVEGTSINIYSDLRAELQHYGGRQSL